MRRIRSSGEWFRTAGFQQVTGKISQGFVPRKPGSTAKFPSARRICFVRSSADLSREFRAVFSPRAVEFSRRSHTKTAAARSGSSTVPNRGGPPVDDPVPTDARCPPSPGFAAFPPMRDESAPFRNGIGVWTIDAPDRRTGLRRTIRGSRGGPIKRTA
jgi:hypothetical protein